jgi:hypothetical protein
MHQLFPLSRTGSEWRPYRHALFATQRSWYSGRIVVRAPIVVHTRPKPVILFREIHADTDQRPH